MPTTQSPSPNMLIDMVDPQDRPVRTIPRRDVFSLGSPFRVAHLFIFNAQGHLLLQQLAATRRRYPLYWGSSMAAYLFAGETYRQAADRRVTQELGIHKLSLREHGKTSMADSGCEKFITLFVSDHNGPFTLDPTHIHAVEFKPLDDIERAVSDGSTKFTPTFLHVFNWYNKP